MSTATEVATTCLDPSGCTEPRNGKSKYCTAHRAEARKRFLAQVQVSVAQREKQNAENAELWKEITELAENVAKLAPATDAKGEVRVNLTPGNKPFANWLKKQGYAVKGKKGCDLVLPGDAPLATKVTYAKSLALSLNARCNVTATIYTLAAE